MARKEKKKKRAPLTLEEYNHHTKWPKRTPEQEKAHERWMLEVRARAPLHGLGMCNWPQSPCGDKQHEKAERKLRKADRERWRELEKMRKKVIRHQQELRDKYG